jgi:hypothetical protein
MQFAAILIFISLGLLYYRQYLALLCSVLLIVIFIKPVRYYLMSYGFPWLYRNKKIAKFFGIRFESDLEWTTNRKDTRIFMSGLFATFFTMFTGMQIETNPDTRRELMYLQGSFGRNITMEPYFNEIDGQTLTLSEFEDFLSKCLLVETNRVFLILDKEREQYFLKHIKIVRDIVNGLTGGTNNSIRAMIANFRSVYEISKIMKSVSEAKRMLLFVPHLSLIDGFSKMLIKTNGNMSLLQPSDFFQLTSKFFVLLNHDNLVFVERHEDKSNNGTNRAFGVKGFSCPGSLYVIKFIKSIFEFLKAMDITVDGQAVISDKRFHNIMNKNQIKITFRRSGIHVYHQDNTDFND